MVVVHLIFTDNILAHSLTLNGFHYLGSGRATRREFFKLISSNYPISEEKSASFRTLWVHLCGAAIAKIYFVILLS